MLDNNALFQIRVFKVKLTAQQFKTLKGQVLAGDAAGAIKGLEKLEERQKRAGAGKEGQKGENDGLFRKENYSL